MKHLQTYNGFETNEQLKPFIKSAFKQGMKYVDDLVKGTSKTVSKTAPKMVSVMTEQQARQALAKFQLDILKKLPVAKETAEYLMDNLKLANVNQWKSGNISGGNVICDDKGLVIVFKNSKMYLKDLEELLKGVADQKMGLNEIEKVLKGKKLITGENFGDELLQSIRAPRFRGAQAPGWELGKGSGKFSE
jgi:hypothetical protein